MLCGAVWVLVVVWMMVCWWTRACESWEEVYVANSWSCFCWRASLAGFSTAFFWDASAAFFWAPPSSSSLLGVALRFVFKPLAVDHFLQVAAARR